MCVCARARARVCVCTRSMCRSYTGNNQCTAHCISAWAPRVSGCGMSHTRCPLLSLSYGYRLQSVKCELKSHPYSSVLLPWLSPVLSLWAVTKAEPREEKSVEDNQGRKFSFFRFLPITCQSCRSLLALGKSQGHTARYYHINTHAAIV